MKCEICGKECRGYSLGNHIVNSIDDLHNITLKVYYDKYLKTDNEGICESCGGSCKFVSLTNGYTESCSRACIAKNPIVQDRMKATLLKNYGVDNASKCPEIQQKKIDTCRERYGVDHHSMLEENQDLKRRTCLTKYGTENVSQLEEIKIKKVDTLKKNYGVEHPMDIPGMKDREETPEVTKKRFLSLLESLESGAVI